MKVLDLFSGVGGFSLAAQRVGWETAGFCEIDPFCRRVLAKHWPAVPCFEDVRELRGSDVGAVDVVCGGFPCQDLSGANPEGQGLDGPRSGLWREMVRLTGELRPRYLVVENVPKLLERGMGRVLGDLAALGMDAWWHCIPASAIGAPHRRDRLWLVAYPHGEHVWGAGPGAAAGTAGAVQTAAREWQRIRAHIDAVGGAQLWAGRQPQPGLFRLADGLSDGLVRARNRAYGNSIVPAIAEALFRWIDEVESA